MRKKNLKPVITGSVLIIPVLLLSAGFNASAKSTLPKINTGTTGIKVNQIKLPKTTPSSGGLKTIANKIIRNPFKTPSSNVKPKFPIDRCNSISPSNGSTNLSSNKTNFNSESTGPIYENVLTLNTSGGGNKTAPPTPPKNRPLPPIPSSNNSSGGSLTKRPAYNPSKGKAPAPPTNVKPYKPGDSTNKNSLSPKNNQNNGNLYVDVDTPNNGQTSQPYKPINSTNKNKLSIKNTQSKFDDPIYEEIDVPNNGQTTSKPYNSGNSTNKNKLSSKNNKNDDPIYDEVYEPIYESINDPIYQNTGNFNDPIYDFPE